MKEYRVLPFDLGLSEREANKAGSAAVAKRLEDVINEMAREGWEYDGYDAIVTTVNPGCLAMFSGPRTVYFGTIAFSRNVPVSVQR